MTRKKDMAKMQPKRKRVYILEQCGSRRFWGFSNVLAVYSWVYSQDLFPDFPSLTYNRFLTDLRKRKVVHYITAAGSFDVHEVVISTVKTPKKTTTTGEAAPSTKPTFLGLPTQENPTLRAGKKRGETSVNVKK